MREERRREGDALKKRRKRKSKEAKLTNEELNKLDLETLCNYIENKGQKNNQKKGKAENKSRDNNSVEERAE